MNKWRLHISICWSSWWRCGNYILKINSQRLQNNIFLALPATHLCNCQCATNDIRWLHAMWGWWWTWEDSYLTLFSAAQHSASLSSLFDSIACSSAVFLNILSSHQPVSSFSRQPISSEKLLINCLNATCPASNSRRVKLETEVDHLTFKGPDIDRRWEKPTQE